MEKTIFTWDSMTWPDLTWISPGEQCGCRTKCCKCSQAAWHVRQVPDLFWPRVPFPPAFLYSWQNVLCQWEDGRHRSHAGFVKGWGRRGWQESLSQVWFVKRAMWSSLHNSVSREMQLQEHGCCSWEIPLCQKDIMLIPKNVLWPLAWGQWIHWIQGKTPAVRQFDCWALEMPLKGKWWEFAQLEEKSSSHSHTR